MPAQIDTNLPFIRLGNQALGVVDELQAKGVQLKRQEGQSF